MERNILIVCLCLGICVASVISKSTNTVKTYEIATDEEASDAGAAVEEQEIVAVRGTFHHRYCKCERHSCSCCHEIKLWFITLYKACVHIVYVPGHFVVRMKVDFLTVLKAIIPLSSHKPMCGHYIAIPICVQIYSVKKQAGKVHACVRVTKPTHVYMGCVEMSLKDNGAAEMKISQMEDN